MTEIELLQEIGNEICEGCGPEADCGIDPEKCSRIKNAERILDVYLQEVVQST